jgi:hypothetical protein
MKLVTLLALASVALPAETLNVAKYRASIESWRDQRERSLKADDGWLTLVGLYWLKEGANRVGSSPDCSITLPEGAPAHAGVIYYSKGRAAFTPEGSKSSQSLKNDREGEPDVVKIGDISFYVIRRGTKDAVRVKDKNSVYRKEFTHLYWYPVKPEWRIDARFVKYDKPKLLTFDSQAGEKQTDQSPGYMVFQRNGKEYRLDATEEDGKLFIVFRDTTAGRTTYPAARFLKADMPTADRGVLDFNMAYNPPCVFTPFATCPLPIPQNRLPIPIDAGEQMYKSLQVH